MKYLILTIILICATQIYAQHNIPFASKDNIIELSVMNESNIKIDNLSIKAIKYPSWVIMQNPKQTIKELASYKENAVEFIFSVDKTAIVNKEESISFAITTPAGEVWTKQVKIVVTPPDRFELYQNYPNPFNPSTVISWQSPVSSWVTLKVFDILGKEVVTLVDEMKEAGYHQVDVDGTNYSSGISSKIGYASGVYFYQITVKDQGAKTMVDRKKMILLR